MTWELIYACIWIFPVQKSQRSNSIVAAEAILNYWLKLAVVVVLFLLGKRKGNGLWSTEHAGTKGQVEQY